MQGATMAPIDNLSDLAGPRAAAVSVDPSYVPFGAACPDHTLFPTKKLARILASVGRNDPALLGRYAMNWAYDPLAREIARRYLQAGCPLAHDGDLSMQMNRDWVFVGRGLSGGFLRIRDLPTLDNFFPAQWVIASASASALFSRAHDSWSQQIILSIKLPRIPTTGVPHA